MKYKGKKVEGRNTEIIAIPRPDGNIVFIAEAVPNWEQFEKLAPVPSPPEKLLPGGRKEPNYQDKKYLEEISKYGQLRTDWLVLTSLRATKELEWETVDYSKPETWPNYREELKESNFTDIEINLIINGVANANSLNEDMIEAAKKDFLAGRE